MKNAKVMENVKIPKGVHDEQKLKFVNKGHVNL